MNAAIEIQRLTRRRRRDAAVGRLRLARDEYDAL